MLTPEAVVPRLRGSFGREYHYAEECASTQRLLPEDAPEGAVAVAEHQTEGRGRLGRTWEDEPGAALLVSLCLRPQPPVARWPELTLAAAQAVAGAIRAVAGVEATLKEPNDVLVRGRKVAGVLAEASDRVVLGVGVNVHASPPGVEATSLEAEAGRRVDRAALLVELLDRLERAYNAWKEA